MMLLRQSTHRMIIRHDPDIGFLYVPNLKARLSNELGGYYVRTNSLGFRSDIEYRNARNRPRRILFFGDSYTAGDGCSNHDRFSERVGQALGAEVYNYGLSGSGTDQQLLICERYAREVDADLAVLCINVENIERIQARRRESFDRVTGNRVWVPKPYFTLDDGQLHLHQVPVPLDRPVVETPSTKSGSESRARRVLDRITDCVSRRLRVDSGQWERMQRVVGSVPLKLRSQILRRIGFQPYRDYESLKSDGWLLMQALVQRFHAGLASMPLLIVPIPTYHYYLHGLRPIYQALFDGMHGPERGVYVSDLTSRLLSLPWDRRERLSFRHDSHFSPVGHEEVARLLREDIVAQGLLANQQTSVPDVAKPIRRSAAKKATYVLGLSCFYHDSAAALIKDGQIVAAAEEERFSRVKNDRRFPHHAANYCLEEGGIQQDDVSAVVYYDNASLTFERIMHTLLAVAPQSEEAWLRMIPSWARYKLHLPRLIRDGLHYDGLVLQNFHHRSHAASAYYPSPFRRAAILTVDGVGEWGTASIGVGAENRMQILKHMCFPHSLGLLYSAFTQFTGFKPNDGEYKMMGLAPYGKPTYVETILNHLVELKEDGSIQLDLKYFAFLSDSTMTNSAFADLFGGPARGPESRITQREMDLARSIQLVTEEVLLRMAKHVHQLTGERHLCLAGGVALNCVANGRLLREGPFDDLWIQPAAGDAGGALGAALDAYYHYFDHADEPRLDGLSSQGGSYWGPAFTDEEIEAFLDTHGYPYRKLSAGERADTLAASLQSGQVLGHFSGRAEFGPRALGARSILGDARNREMQVNLNLKIKYRESFRPFAPAVLAEKAKEYFDLEGDSPYMLLVAPVKEERRQPAQSDATTDDLLSIVRQLRSDIPAVTHVDYSARIQTVREETHPEYYALIDRFERRTGYSVIVNTSFNVRGEPIVCTPYDAYRCFMRTEMDLLALGPYLLVKAEQPVWPETKGHLENPGRLPQAHLPKKFLKELRRIYAGDFVPVALSLGEHRSARILSSQRECGSNWVDFTGDHSPKAIFVIPEALDSANPKAGIMAQAITESWSPGLVTEALRPILVKLIALSQRFPATDSLDEAVSESVYVMF